MSRLLASCLIVLGTGAALSSQSAPIEWNVLVSFNEDATGGQFAMLGLEQTEFYIGEPSVIVPAKAMPGATLKASQFAVRAWREADKIQAVVYAVVPDPIVPNGALETPIATYTLPVGQRVRVTQTEQWGASPIVLSTLQRSKLR